MPAAIQFLRRHAVALLVTALAFIFTLFLWPLSHRFPFALFVAAVLASAWQGGPRSALITTALSGAILFGLYWLFSAEQMAELGFDYLTRLGLFLFVGLLASYLSHQCRKATQALEVAGATLAGAGQALIFVDGQSRVTSLNSLAETLTGWTPEEAIGRPVEQVFHLRQERSGQPLECPVGTVLRGGGARPFPEDAAVLALDSRQTPVEGAAVPLHNTAQKLIAVLITFHEITARKQAEAASRTREDKLRLQMAEQQRAGESWTRERDQLRQALAQEKDLRQKAENALQTTRIDLEKAMQAQAAGLAQADAALQQLRADYEQRLQEHVQKQAEAEEALHAAQAEFERRLAEATAAHEQDHAALRQGHSELGEKLTAAACRHQEVEEALQQTQTELAALRQQRDTQQQQAAAALQQIRTEAETSVQQVHADWEKRLADREAENGQVRSALEQNLADHRERLSGMDQEQQALRQERDSFQHMVALLALAHTSTGTAGDADAVSLQNGENGAERPKPAGPVAETLDWLAFN